MDKWPIPSIAYVFYIFIHLVLHNLSNIFVENQNGCVQFTASILNPDKTRQEKKLTPAQAHIFSLYISPVLHNLPNIFVGEKPEWLCKKCMYSTVQQFNPDGI